MALLNIQGEIAETNQYGDGTRYVVLLGKGEDCYEAGTDEIFASIKENPFLDGITVMGSEPFDCARELNELLRKIKELKLNVIVDTGYTLDELLKKAKQDEEIYDLLKLTDTLIDGTFVKAESEKDDIKGIIDMKKVSFL